MVIQLESRRGGTQTRQSDISLTLNHSSYIHSGCKDYHLETTGQPPVSSAAAPGGLTSSNDSTSSWADKHAMTLLVAGAVGVHQPQVQSQEKEL